jgi:rubrerythrin
MIDVYELTDKYTICDYVDGEKSTPIFQISETSGIHEIIKKDDVFYSVCCISREEKKIAVKKLSSFVESEEVEETYEDEWTCPYCGYIDYDAFELAEEEENHHCPNCGSTVTTHREISCHYSVEPVKANDITEYERISKEETYAKY